MPISKIKAGGINDDAVTTAKIVDGTVAAVDIANGAVTSAKLDTNIDIAGTLDVTSTLTADGNVLVGTTDVSQYDNNSDSSDDNGISLRGSIGKIEIARYNSEALDVNRTGTEGNLAVFRKNGTPVGSIGTSSSTGGMYIDGGSSATGLRFGNSGHVIPRRSNADSDANVDFGVGTNRFRNLYLSGGVYVGGTAPANYLDDYEEGTWNPVITPGGGSFSISSNAGYYTKIGRLVYITAWWHKIGESSPSGGITVSGLPFATAATTTNSRTRIHLSGYNFASLTGRSFMEMTLGNSSTTGQILVGTDSYAGAAVLTAGNFTGSNTEVYFNGFYYTDT